MDASKQACGPTGELCKPTYLERGRLNSCYLCPHSSRSQASGTISFRQANSSHGPSSIKRGARDWNQHPCAVPSLHAALRKGALNRLTSQGVTSLALLTRTDGPSHPSLPFGHKNHDVGGSYTPAISAPQSCSGWERECATSLPRKKISLTRTRFGDSTQLPSTVSSTPSLSWRSSSVRSWRCTLSSRWRMLFNTTRSYGIPRTIVFAANLLDTTTTLVISVTTLYNPKDS